MTVSHLARSRNRRRPASAVPSIRGLRISPPGFRATLVNISSTGLLAEWGLSLKIGQAVTVAFEGASTPPPAEARVVRSAIVSTSPAGLRYHLALAFTVPIVFDGGAPLARETAPSSGVADTIVDDVVNQW